MNALHPSVARLPRTRAFTLLELLVVVGLIAVLAAGLGLAMGDSGGNALAAGQATVAALAGTARAQAVLHQTTAVLAVYFTRPPAGDAENCLRLLQVFRDTTPDATIRTWVPVASPVLLPRGVFVVPTSITGWLAPGAVWPTDPPLVSSLETLNLAQPAGAPFAVGDAALALPFSSDGTVAQVGPGSTVRLVLASAVQTESGPRFNHAGAVRGIRVRQNGAISCVDHAAGF